MKYPRLVVCDAAGNVIEAPEFAMAAAAAGSLFVPDAESIVPLPKESVFYLLPGRHAVGYEPAKKRFITVKEYAGKQVFAAAAHLPPDMSRPVSAPIGKRLMRPGFLFFVIPPSDGMRGVSAPRLSGWTGKKGMRSPTMSLQPSGKAQVPWSAGIPATGW